jgi:hypothetical protein
MQRKNRSLTGSKPCGGLQRENQESALSIYKNCLALAAITPHGLGCRSYGVAPFGKGRYKLSGRVEVDEFFIGGKKSGKRGRGAEGKTIVLVAVERDTVQDPETLNHYWQMGRVRLKVALDCTAFHLRPSFTTTSKKAVRLSHRQTEQLPTCFEPGVSSCCYRACTPEKS